MTYIPGKHKFECMICRGWFLSDNKRVMWNDAITCQKCWDKKPWFLQRIPKLRNELAPVRNPSPNPDASYLTGFDTWDSDNTVWNLDYDVPFFNIKWEE
jgi:hypothetical protein